MDLSPGRAFVMVKLGWGGGSALTKKTYTSIDPAPLGRVVVIALYADLVVGALYGLSSLLSVADVAAADASAPADTPLPNDMLVGAMALAQLVTALVVGF